MIPTDIILIDFAIIGATCTFWGVVWQLFLKDKISTYNQRVEDEIKEDDKFADN